MPDDVRNLNELDLRQIKKLTQGKSGTCYEEQVGTAVESHGSWAVSICENVDALEKLKTG